MDILLIIGAIATMLAIGYFILRKPNKADLDLNAGSRSALQNHANTTIDAHLKASGHGSIHRRNGRYVYDDGSFIMDLILLDILMDGELDFNFIPEYDENAYDAEANAAIFAEVDTILPTEQTFEKEGDLEVRDRPEVAVESTYTPEPEPPRSYGGDTDGGYGGGGDSGGGGGDSGGSDD
jgi:hypothetical protein